MISVVVYGRNDNYGYNLQKRASLSLNCIASVLSDPDDEILFVDYNTPDDFPTFPEAIRDTLTEKTINCLRILRVRPEIHRRFESKTHLSALEPIARNVAIRRSNAKNRWILSTNTDMIFAPLQQASLTEIVRQLPGGYYHLPRFDLPESLWETFDRLNPDQVLRDVKKLGEVAHLNEVVLGAKHVKYDAPGDFQLIQRTDLFAIHGFCEDMLLGWHLDSNLGKRLYLRYGWIGDLADFIRGYHCEHTRSFSTMHYTKTVNDMNKFIDNISHPELPNQSNSWGCKSDVIEEIRLTRCPADLYRASLGEILHPPMALPTQVAFVTKSYDRLNYEPEHVLPYLADLFVNCPRNWNVGWFGGKTDMLSLFVQAWQALKFEGKILIVKRQWHLAVPNSESLKLVDNESLLEEANAFVFDFGEISGENIDRKSPNFMRAAEEMLSYFWDVVVTERVSARNGHAKRRVITINAMHNYLERTVGANVSCPKMSITKRLRHGFVNDDSLEGNLGEPRKIRLLEQLEVGPAGIRHDGNIRTRLGRSGHVFYGPYFLLRPAKYRIVLGLSNQSLSKVGQRRKWWTFPRAQPQRPLVFEVVAGEHYLAQMEILSLELQNEYVLEFDLSDPSNAHLLHLPFEVRLWADGHIDASIIAVELEGGHI